MSEQPQHPPELQPHHLKQIQDSAISSEVAPELRRRQQWVCWRYQERDGKRTKVPHTPAGKLASTTDPTSWRDYDTVHMAADAFDGIGFVFSMDDPYIGIDLDHVRDAETGAVLPWALEVVAACASY